MKTMEGYIAEIRLFAGMFAPLNWAFCEGQMLSIDQHQSLFSLIGTTYGGDGRTNFNLPDLKGKEPQEGMHYIICMAGIYPSRN
ncbi:MAG: tail fiber protein [Saprospiraceae bacterium]